MSYSKAFDSEDLLDGIEQIMLSDLNTRISAIEAEKIAKSKGLSPTLAAVDATSYFRQSWSEKILNISPAIFYGIEDVKAVSNGPAVSKQYSVFVMVVYFDNGMTNDTHRRISRYSRALEEIFRENFASYSEMGLLKIETIRPLSYKLEEDSSEEMKVGGVSLTMTLA